MQRHITIVSQTGNHLQLITGSIKIDFIKEQIPLRFPLKPLGSQLRNITLADSRDIGCMKLLSIATRGSKKDFVDLYCLTRKLISLESLVALFMEGNQAVRYSKLLFLKGLVDFEEAEKEPDPQMIWNVPWDRVKEDLTREVINLSRKIEKRTKSHET